MEKWIPNSIDELLDERIEFSINLPKSNFLSKLLYAKSLDREKDSLQFRTSYSMNMSKRLTELLIP